MTMSENEQEIAAQIRFWAWSRLSPQTGTELSLGRLMVPSLSTSTSAR